MSTTDRLQRTMNNTPSLPSSSHDRRQTQAPLASPRLQVGQGPNPGPVRAQPSFPGMATSPNFSGLYLPEGRLQAGAINELTPLHQFPPRGSGASGLMTQTESKQLYAPANMMGAAQQHQLQNAEILRSLMGQKLQLSMYEDQIRHRMMLAPSAPILQASLMNDPRFLMGGMMGVGGNLRNLNARLPASLPSPHELSFKADGRSMRGGVIEPFPEKLHRLLLEVEAAGRSDVISFIANGKAFAIHKPDKFFKEIVPQYFRQSRLSSFKRQLNLYGFELINTGPARGGYYHKSFVKDHPELCRKMRRVAVKVNATNQEGNPLEHFHNQPEENKEQENKEQETTQKDEKSPGS